MNMNSFIEYLKRVCLLDKVYGILIDYSVDYSDRLLGRLLG